MQLNPYLTFNGRCEEAFRFYEWCLGGKIVTMMAYAGTPTEGHVPPEWRNKILHARLVVGDEVLMGCDTPPEHYEQPKGFAVLLEMKEPADAERIFQALSDNGKVQMPLQQTFWAARFAMLVDQFSVPWMINCGGAA
jgi:PhnB protein